MLSFTYFKSWTGDLICNNIHTFKATNAKFKAFLVSTKIEESYKFFKKQRKKKKKKQGKSSLIIFKDFPQQIFKF